MLSTQLTTPQLYYVDTDSYRLVCWVYEGTSFATSGTYYLRPLLAVWTEEVEGKLLLQQHHGESCLFLQTDNDSEDWLE